MAKIQKQGVKTLSEVTGAGGAASDLINDTQIYVSANSLNKQLSAAISAGDFASSLTNINYLKNGEFRFWQRLATPTTLTNVANGAYCSDRFYMLNSGPVNMQAAQVAEVPTVGATTQFIGQFRQANSTARQFGVLQVLPYADCVQLRGKTVTFGCNVRTDGTEITTVRMGIVEWTGTQDSPTKNIVSSWAATPTLIANATFKNTPADITISSSWSQISVSATLGTTFNNLYVFIWTPNTEAQNDDLYLTQVQLVQSSSTLLWNNIQIPRDIDYNTCLSFYWRFQGNNSSGYLGTGYFDTTTRAYYYIPFPAPMRKSPAIGVSAVGDITMIRPGTSPASATAANASAATTGFAGAYLDVSTASASTVGYATLVLIATNGYYEVDAEIGV